MQALVDTAAIAVVDGEGEPIYIVTSDLVAETGRITWEYFFADDTMPRDFMDAIMCAPWGWAWRPAYHSQTVCFNLFESGKGLLLGGGFAGDGDGWDRKHLDAVPSCSLLMTTAVFEYLRDTVLTPFNRPYVRFHSEQILYTSKKP